jgi:Domain of Unknown Function (DUF1080)
MNHRNLIHLPLMMILFGSCINKSAEKDWEPLLNGTDLTGWETYLGPAWDTLRNDWDSVPVGYNVDPHGVFSIVDLEGEKVLRISGEYFGGINTTREFDNYHLQLQFKWGQAKWPPRKTGKMDSGLMYHAVGPQGADGGFWMRSQEFQVEEGDCGDYWACAGAIADIPARMQPDSTYLYNKDADLVTFSNTSVAWRHCIKSPDAEKPSGEWNTLDLYCLGDTSVHVVNGVVTMTLYNSRQLEGSTEIPLTKGKIQIESEGAEVYYRNIQIRSIDRLPEEVIK